MKRQRREVIEKNTEREESIGREGKKNEIAGRKNEGARDTRKPGKSRLDPERQEERHTLKGD